jgi:hypothetical protein
MSTTLDRDDKKLKDINDTLTEIINLKCFNTGNGENKNSSSYRAENLLNNLVTNQMRYVINLLNKNDGDLKLSKVAEWSFNSISENHFWAKRNVDKAKKQDDLRNAKIELEKFENEYIEKLIYNLSERKKTTELNNLNNDFITLKKYYNYLQDFLPKLEKISGDYCETQFDEKNRYNPMNIVRSSTSSPYYWENSHLDTVRGRIFEFLSELLFRIKLQIIAFENVLGQRINAPVTGNENMNDIVPNIGNSNGGKKKTKRIRKNKKKKSRKKRRKTYRH